MEKPHDPRFGGSNIKISLLPTKKKTLRNIYCSKNVKKTKKKCAVTIR